MDGNALGGRSTWTSRMIMKRRARGKSGNLFLAWTGLWWKVGEMSIASAQVIAHRTARIAAAGPNPNARDRQEFARMGREKIEAATASASAIASQLASVNYLLGARSLRHAATGTAALMSLASSRSATQLLARQAKLAWIMVRSAETALALSSSGVRVAALGLKPVHARATANARRLGRR